LLKQIASAVTRASILRNATNSAEIGRFAAMQSAATLLGIELCSIDMLDPAEIDPAITAFARGPNDGLIVTAGARQTPGRSAFTSGRPCAPSPTRSSNNSGGELRAPNLRAPAAERNAA
jgi:hypothetical protein